MTREGPPIERLMRHLAETPADFLDEPRIGPRGTVDVAALLNDVLTGLGVRVSHTFLKQFRFDAGHADRNGFKLAMLAAWLLADEWFATARPDCDRLADFLSEALRELAAQGTADRYVQDPERREELARTALARLDYRPKGETAAQATDRLTRISSAERQRLVAASRVAEQRSREVREALARQAAHVSADKWTRE